MHRHNFVFCTHCNATTRWEQFDTVGDDEPRFQCQGDHDHPWRTIAGCGTIIKAEEFRKRREAARPCG